MLNLMSYRITRLVTAGAVVLAVAACMSAGARPGTGDSVPTRSTSTVIIAADLQATKATNLYDAIQQFHPEWFGRTGAISIRDTKAYAVEVFIDNQRAGGIDVLRQTSLSHALAVRYFPASQAQMRFGLGNLNGVIQIMTTAGTPNR